MYRGLEEKVLVVVGSGLEITDLSVSTPMFVLRRHLSNIPHSFFKSWTVPVNDTYTRTCLVTLRQKTTNLFVDDVTDLGLFTIDDKNNSKETFLKPRCYLH